MSREKETIVRHSDKVNLERGRSLIISLGNLVRRVHDKRGQSSADGQDFEGGFHGGGGERTKASVDEERLTQQETPDVFTCLLLL